MKVLIAGGSGYIGRRLSVSLVKAGHDVIVLSRQPKSESPPSGVRYLTWDARSGDGGWVKELAGAQGIVNLAGATIGSWPWTRRRMAEMLSSRLSATAALVQALERLPAEGRPSVLISASGIDYYGDRGDEVVTEDSQPGDSFLARLSLQWENAAQKAEPLGLRVVRMRTSMVFGRDAPAFNLLTLPVRLFVGGPLGSGRQWFTWIHIDDIVGLYRFGLENEQLSGAVNAVATDVRRQVEVAKEIGRILHRPTWFPAPAPLLRVALGAMSELLLDGRKAVPEKAKAAGYRFEFGGLPQALEEALRSR
ncbi:MAG TPA: TIGR01777 family oxidoreductase [Candidatus Acidoferrum sp.]|nr:TIGR01777 family oxidoreductase [Candidatus Acidoferrum sp.]